MDQVQREAVILSLAAYGVPQGQIDELLGDVADLETSRRLLQEDYARLEHTLGRQSTQMFLARLSRCRFLRLDEFTRIFNGDGDRLFTVFAVDKNRDVIRFIEGLTGEDRARFIAYVDGMGWRF